MVHWVWPWNQLVVLLMFRQFQVCMYILSIIIYHIPLYIYKYRCWLLAFTHIYLLHRKFSESAYPWVQSRLSPFLKGDFFPEWGHCHSRFPLSTTWNLHQVGRLGPLSSPTKMPSGQLLVFPLSSRLQNHGDAAGSQLHLRSRPHLKCITSSLMQWFDPSLIIYLYLYPWILAS